MLKKFFLTWFLFDFCFLNFLSTNIWSRFVKSESTDSHKGFPTKKRNEEEHVSFCDKKCFTKRSEIGLQTRDVSESSVARFLYYFKTPLKINGRGIPKKQKQKTKRKESFEKIIWTWSFPVFWGGPTSAFFFFFLFFFFLLPFFFFLFSQWEILCPQGRNSFCLLTN